MSTRVLATARLNASYRHKLRERFSLSVDPASELSRLESTVGSHQLILPDLQQLISTPSTSLVLRMLAPAEFSRVRARMEGGSRFALETTTADMQTELAETLAAAIAVLAAATRDIIADGVAESGRKLGYTVTSDRAQTATCVELRHGRETVLVKIHDGGDVEFDHSGLADDTCAARQLQLERTAGRHGIVITPRT